LVTDLIGNIKDGNGILIVSIADVATIVTLVWTSINQALGIVDVVVGRSATSGSHVGWVADVKEDKTAIARHLGEVTNTGSDVTSDRACSNRIPKLLVDDNVMGSAL
jgi:hypothetical protein